MWFSLLRKYWYCTFHFVRCSFWYILHIAYFYPRPVLTFGYCHRLRLCVCPCVRACMCINDLIVRTITHQPFKLESANLDGRRITPWLGCLSFLGVIDLHLQGQIKLAIPNVSNFELVQNITCHPFKLQSPNLDQKCILIQLRSLLIWGILNLQLQFHFKS